MHKPANNHSSHPLARLRGLLVLASLLLALLIWQLIASLSGLPSFILPSPAQVWQKFLESLTSGLLLRHVSATLIEILLGLLFGTILGAVGGYLLAKSPLAERLLSPFLIASQSVPMVAIAPLLIIWFGPGLFSKTLICTLVVLFPVLINTLVGIRETPRDLYELMGSLRATPAQVLRKLEVPAALPVFMGGLRMGATLSVIGAIVGEMVGSDRGLGFLVNVGRGQYDTALVFVSVISMMLLSIALYSLILLLERRLLRWQTWRLQV